MKIAIGSDHGGFEMKEALKEFLAGQSVQVEDVGCFSKDPVDYPDMAALVAAKVSQGLVDQGILICTTGIGVSIVANKFPRVRAALCLNPRMAMMAGWLAAIPLPVKRPAEPTFQSACFPRRRRRRYSAMGLRHTLPVQMNRTLR